MEEINLEELTFEKDDLLNRKQIAINLTNIIKNKSNLNVLAIDSSWGTGKTTFINKWINMLKTDPNYNTTFETIYFNAWESDYSNDALLSLIFQINKSISKTLENNKPLLEKHKEKLKNIGKIAGTVALKYATKGVFDSTDWNENLEKGLSEFSDKIGSSIFKQHSIQKDARDLLKKNLLEYQELISKKIIIFIDELDRCKPTYSIQILETIKHLFNLDNYVFVISLDKEQLSHSIKTVYGQDMNSTSYLRRFFNLEYQLPNKKTQNYLNKKLDELDKNLLRTQYLKIFLSEIFTQEDYTLRDVDKVIAFTELLLLNVDFFTSNNLGPYNFNYLITASYLYSFIINLKFQYPNLLNDLIKCNYENTSESFSRFKTFDLDKCNLTKYSIDETWIKDFLRLSISMFLKINLLSSYSSIDDLIVNNYNDYFLECEDEYLLVDIERKKIPSVNLLTFFNDNNNILKKLQFTEEFKI
ncbi:KAP family P-loop NTPase fold protein [Clostridium perfringens]